MHTGNSASDGPDDRQSATDGDYVVSRRSVLKGAAAAALGATALRSAPNGVRADHAPPVDWTATTLDADGASDAFGSSLTLDAAGETLVVGDPTRREGEVRTGGVSVYVSEDGGWTRETVLPREPRARLDYVGESVDVDAAGETVVVGMPGEDALAGQCGGVLVFVRESGSWTQEARLMAGDEAATRDHLGTAVAVDDAGERVVAGAPAADATPARTGAAYVFDRTEDSDGGASWSRTAKLQLPDGSADDHAGESVSLSADGATALVGAPGAADGAGVVAAFTEDPWDHVRSAENPTDAAAAFGSATATNGTDSVLCAPEAPASDSGESETDSSDRASGPTGYAGVFGGISLAPVQRLSAEGGSSGERVGTDAALATDGDCAVVGAVFDGDSASGEGGGDSGVGGETGNGESPSTGGAYVFDSRDGGWSQSSRLAPPESADGSQFGRAVATGGGGHVVAVGGRRQATGGQTATAGTDTGTGTPSSAATGTPSSSAATGTVTVFTRESPGVSIDIEPDEEWPASVPYEGSGEIEVCIEHTDEFDPTTVDVGTLRFGPPRVVDEGDGARAVGGGSEEDADSDGDRDLVVRFPVGDAGFDPDDFAARLVGETIYGTPISDHDFVVTTDDDSDGGSGSTGNETGGGTGGNATGNGTSGDGGSGTTPVGNETSGDQTSGNGTDGGAL
ncbi:FG-GAP repeat protein [Halosimplex aquaticum]|uniref:FG-GAP repeat protein n=1 Tax=Halosimplex aquaticum TaxID=3026162 RepID=A0ABD5Y5P5_9EURY|nr:FG-GAP repeat protein [Halosimplex aquaticum]